MRAICKSVSLWASARRVSVFHQPQGVRVLFWGWGTLLLVFASFSRRKHGTTTL